MKLEPLPLGGAFLIESEPFVDERGSFIRTFCAREFAEHGLDPTVAQCSQTITEKRGTLRGLHYQIAPHQETKLVRCVRGAIFDVIVDLREGSPTFRRSHAVTLASPHAALYVPRGFAHGFLSLADDVIMHYQMSAEYHAESARGVRWDDPVLSIAWPFAPLVINQRDASFSLL